MCKDFEKYWGEYNPIVVSFEKLKRGDIDRATKTATYTINFHYNWSVKHKRIAEAVLKGLNLVRKADWSQGIPKKWPATSIFEKDIKFDHYISNGFRFFMLKKEMLLKDVFFMNIMHPTPKRRVSMRHLL